MEALYIPQPDMIPVAWGWFKFLLLLTLPLHLLLMNAMVGSLVLGLGQHIQGGMVRTRLAHRIAIALPLIIAFVVNIGVAPLLFLQVLYGQFNYSSSVLMGSFWILIIPMLIIAYYGAYLYDFKFTKLGGLGIVVGALSLVLIFGIGSFFTNNMLLTSLPGKFGEYFNHMDGTLLIFDHPEYLPRYLHMMVGAISVGGLYVALLGHLRRSIDPEVADHSLKLGMRTFFIGTLINVAVGIYYLVALPKEQMMIFMGGNMGASVALLAGLLLTVGALVTSYKRKLWLTVGHVVALVYVMVFMRAWLRAGALQDVFTLDQLQVVPQYSPLIFFLATLLVGVAALIWLWRKTAVALANQ